MRTQQFSRLPPAPRKGKRGKPLAQSAPPSEALCGALSYGPIGARDHLESIVEALRLLPESEQAEVVRRLGNPEPDLGLAAIVAAWPKLPPAVRAGVASAVEGFAKADEPRAE